MSKLPENKRRVGVWDFLFGGVVVDDDRHLPTFNYQHRQNMIALSMGGFAFLWWLASVALLAYFSAAAAVVGAFAILYLKLHFVAIESGNAVFDSIWERINLQSTWLDVRLSAIEQGVKGGAQVGSLSGQQEWLNQHAHDGQLSGAWDSYPEKNLTLPPKNASLAEQLNFGQGERKCQRARGRSTRWNSRSRRFDWCAGARA